MASLIDPKIRARQADWVNELESMDTSSYKSFGRDVFASVSDQDGLAGLWLVDSLYARSIDFPQTDYQLLCYRLVRSRALRLIYNVAVSVQIVLPFFATASCGYSRSLAFEDKFIAIDVICLLIYCTDLYLSFSVNISKKSFLRKPWSAFRLVCCVLLFLDCLAFSDYYFSGLRLVRCVFPFFLISRRTNLQKMFQGIFVSGLKSLSVIVALLSVLVLWSFLGFLVFRNLASEAGSHRFNTLPDSMFATLHCFTSRPFCLLALKPFFAVSQASAVFFVTLTIAADVTCIGLIVAIGTSEYKQFASKMVKRRLKSRLFGLKTIFDAYATDGRFSKDSWIKLCNRLRYGYRRTHGEAVVIFSMEDAEERQSVDLEGFLRLCSLLSSRVVVVVPVNRLVEIDKSISNHAGHLADILSSNAVFISTSEDFSSRSHHDLVAMGDRLDESMRGRLSISTHHSPSSPSSISLAANLMEYVEYFRGVCFVLATAHITIDLPCSSTHSVTLRSMASFCNHLLLVLYLCFISAGNAHIGWHRLGEAIEFFFWLDMIIKISAYGFNDYNRSIFNKTELVVNVASFISMCIMGQGNHGAKDGSLIATLIIQSVRFFVLFFMVNDLEIFERIYPIMIRALFIYFSVVYFFAIFGHTFFCGSLNTTAASGGDDDSSNWINYADELNFSTYLQSFFTMFELSLLANWSIVMDAAARVSGIGSYFFFYTYRLLVTLFVLPLLLGFVMQAFLGARKAQQDAEAVKAALVKEEREKARLSSRSSTNSWGVGLVWIGKDKERPPDQRSSGSSDVSSSNPLQPPDLNGDFESRPSLNKLLPDIRLVTQARQQDTPYSVSSNRKKSTSRLSLWSAPGVAAPVAASPTRTTFSSAPSSAPGPPRGGDSPSAVTPSKTVAIPGRGPEVQGDRCPEDLLLTIQSLREQLESAHRKIIALGSEPQQTCDPKSEPSSAI